MPKKGFKVGGKNDLVFDGSETLADIPDDFDWGAYVPIEDVEEPEKSFDSLKPEPAPVKKAAGRKYIVSTTTVDKFTTIRKRVLLTPSRCTVLGCNFDIALHNGFHKGWKGVPAGERGLMLEALEQHRRVAHNQSEDHIIDEKDLPKRWLGAERGMKDL